MAVKTNEPVVNLTIYAGDDWNRQIKWSQSGVAVDITNYAAIMKISVEKGQATPEFELTIGSGIALTDPTNGMLTISLSDMQTATMADSYFYDLMLTSPGDIDTTIIYGKINVIDQV